MAILFNMFVGLGLLAISGMMFWARGTGWSALLIRRFIENRFLGGKDMTDTNAPYATELSYLRWPLLATALTTVIPVTMFSQDIEIVMLYGVVYLVVRALMILIEILKGVKRFFMAKAEREEYDLEKLKGKQP